LRSWQKMKKSPCYVVRIKACLVLKNALTCRLDIPLVLSPSFPYRPDTCCIIAAYQMDLLKRGEVTRTKRGADGTEETVGCLKGPMQRVRVVRS